MSWRWCSLLLGSGACATAASPPAPREQRAAPAAVGAAALADAAAPATDAAAPVATDAATTPRAFDAETAPRSKIALIDALDRSLRKGELGSLPDGAPLVERCEATSDAGLSLRPLADQLGECLELTDWSRARRAALNFGTNSSPYAADCPELTRIEPSELYYAVDDQVFKVKLTTVSLRGGFAAVSVRCTRKGGSARELERLPVNCPGRPWSRVTQSEGRCP